MVGHGSVVCCIVSALKIVKCSRLCHTLTIFVTLYFVKQCCVLEMLAFEV